MSVYFFFSSVVRIFWYRQIKLIWTHSQLTRYLICCFKHFTVSPVCCRFLPCNFLSEYIFKNYLSNAFSTFGYQKTSMIFLTLLWPFWRLVNTKILRELTPFWICVFILNDKLPLQNQSWTYISFMRLNYQLA